MNREEYLKRLSFLLKDLQEEEIEDAIAYYEDYFEEAGEEKEEQVIKELGSPEKIARMIHGMTVAQIHTRNHNNKIPPEIIRKPPPINNKPYGTVVNIL